METTRLLTLREVADRLGMTYKWTARILPTMGLPYARVGRGRGTIRVKQADLDQYMIDRTTFKTAKS